MTEASQDSERNRPTTVESTLGWLAVVLAGSLPLYRPWAGLAAHFILVLWFLAPDLRTRCRNLLGHRLTLAVLAFVALNVISLAWSDHPAQGLRYVAQYRYLLLIPMLATGVPLQQRRLAAPVFVGACSASAALSLAIALDLITVRATPPANPSPVMAHLDFSVVLAVGALLALVHALFRGAGRGSRLAWSGGFLVIATALAVNIGRSGQLGFVVGLVAVLVHWSRSRSVASAAVAATVLVGAASVLVVTSPPAVERIRSAADDFRAAVVDHDYESNIGGRLAALTVSAAILRDHPVFGTGVGANMPEFRRQLDTAFPDLKSAVYWYRHLHNQYAQVATELGLAGLAALLWIFWELLRGASRPPPLSAAAIAVAAVYLVGFTGEPFLQKQIPVLVFAVSAGLIAAADLAPTTAETISAGA